MAAIITDQLRILNAKNFVAGIQSSTNSYYSFIGLPNPASYQSTWNQSPPSPLDSLDQTNQYWDKDYERSLFWKDSDLNINWPLANDYKYKIITNYKDSIAPTFKEIEKSGDLF